MINKLKEKFRIIFRKKEDDSVSDPPAYEPVCSDAGEVRIGILEYFEEMRQVYAKFLDGYSYHITHDCEEFISQLDSFDAVIIDKREPDINGFQISASIKNDKPDLPVIICSKDASLEAVEEFKVSKADAYLIKPISKEELSGCLKRVMVKVIPEPVVEEKKPAKRGRKPFTFLDVAEKHFSEFEESGLSKAEFARKNKTSLSGIKNEFKIVALPESAKKIIRENTDAFKKSFFEHICKLDEQSIIDICSEISEQAIKGNYYDLAKVKARAIEYQKLGN